MKTCPACKGTICNICGGCVNCGECGCRADRLEAMVDRMADTIVDLRAELLEANSLLRSAFSVAEREGRETNWDAFRRKVKAALDRQHKIIYADQPPTKDGE